MRRPDRAITQPTRRHRRRITAGLESLESRLLMAANPVIAEFLADNQTSIVDGNGAHSDWIELVNRGDAPQDLTGWHLTDDTLKPAKWTFPARTLAPGQYLIVFASGNNAVDPAGYLHTNFSLNADGEYLALTRPNGSVASEFGPGGANFPKQLQDVSYGSGTVVDERPIVGPGINAKAFVPTNNTLDNLTWVSANFDDSTWTSGKTGVGFDTGGFEDVQPPPTLKARWAADDLAASLTSGQTITTWTDDVANHPATGAGKPLFQANVINGHAVARFNPLDGNDQVRVTSANNPLAGAEDFTVTVVFRTGTAGLGGASVWTSNTGIVDASQAGTTNDWGMSINSSGQIGAGLGGPDVTAYSANGKANGAAHVAVLTRVDDTIKVYVDGGDGVATAGSATARNVADLVFGSLQTSANYFNGDLAEIDLYTGGVGAAAAYTLASQLGSKYAVTITAPSATPPGPAVIGKWSADDLNGLSNNAVVGSWVSSVGGATATGSGAPRLVKSQLNGHSVVRFDPTDGTNDQLRIAAASNPMSNRGDFSLAVVFRTSTVGAGGVGQWYQNTGIVDAEQGGVVNDWGLVLNSSGQAGAGIGNPDTTLYSNNGLADNSAHVLVYTRRGATFQLYVDGGVAYSGAAPTALRNSADMVFGSIQTNLNYYKGDIAEVQVLSGGLDAGAADTLASQLALKYGVALAPDPYDPLIGLNLESAMSDTRTSAYVRVPFTYTDDLTGYDKLTLRMRYDDGFIAYLNGVEVARRNAPASAGFNSTATAPRADALALVPEDIDISQFKNLLKGGGQQNILAIHALNSSATDPDLLLIPELVAGRTFTGNTYFVTPTPGAPNAQGYADYVRDVHFSVDRGVVAPGTVVDVTATTPGATIVYTTDGSVPTLTNGTIVNSADASTAPVAHVTVNKTTTLRATAFRNTYLPTNVDTSSYVVVATVLSQGNAQPAGAYWDTEVDPNVVNATQTYSVSQALTAIPSISLVLPNADMFGPNGIYTNPLSKGSAWEREASVEYFDPSDPTSQFQVDAGLRIEGGVSRDPSRPKKSFRIFFRGEYGTGKLDFPLFGQFNPHVFNNLVLRGGHNYTWANEPSQFADYLHDEFARRTQQDMTGVASVGRFVQLYINGLYWGLYDVTEQPDESFASTHLGGNPGDYDVLQPDNNGGVELLAGTTDAWNNLFATADAAASSGGAIDNTEFANLQKLVDVPGLIDYMLSNFYRGDRDSPTLIGNGISPRNFYAIRNRNGGAFTFQTWDGELSLDDVNLDRTETAGNLNPARLFQQLRTNAEFRQLVADHVYKNFFNGGPLTQAAATARYQQLVSEINVAIVGESARWGDAKREPAYTRDTDWLNQVNFLLNTYFPQRTTVVFNQLKADYPMLAVTPPQFLVNGQLKRGGNVAAGDALALTNPNGVGTIYYTTDGSDPRLVGGGISPSARAYTGTLPIADNLTITTRILNGATWSAVDIVGYTIHTLAAAGNVVVSEVNYNPVDPTPAELAVNPAFTADDFEFVELLNTGTKTVDLLNGHFDVGVTITFGNSSVAPGQRVVLVKNLAAFRARYGAAPVVAGTYTGTLSNSGETLRLLSASNAPIEQFVYADGWSGRTDGKGSTLEIISPTGDFNSPSNWRRSYEYNGTPGSAGAGPQTAVVINEVLTNTASPDKDAIELHNTTAADVDLSGWFLSDSSDNYKKFRIPDGTIIAANGYLVFTESDFNPTPITPGPNDFALDGARGDDVWLVKAAPSSQLIGFNDSVHFGAAPQGQSLGRWPDGSGRFYPMISPTLGAPNSDPVIGPAIITEIMYHPAGVAPASDDLEYVEIQNTTAAPLDLSGWKFTNGVDFTFASGTVLQAYEPLVIVHFDPADSAKLAAFRAQYGIDTSVRIVGPYTGTLNDLGEDLTLSRPDTPPATDPTFIPYVLVDDLEYSTTSPWPAAPATGAGQSLSRNTASVFGDDPATWTAAAPTVGSVPFGHAYFQGGTSYTYADTATLDSLTIRGATTVALAAGGKTLRTGALTLDPAARFDLKDGYAIVDATAANQSATLAQITAALRTGYNASGAKWTGPGITSSIAAANADTAVGVLANPGTIATFGGQSVSPTAILLRYTLAGDATLDGAVDFNDLVKLAQNYNTTTPTTTWSAGDFNYDATVDFNDLVQLAQHYNTALPSTPGAAPIVTGSAPMPSLASVLAQPAPTPAPTEAPTPKPAPKPVAKPAPAPAVKSVVKPTPTPVKPAARSVTPITPPSTFSTTPIAKRKTSDLLA